jgi:hypothetical protein
MARMFPERLTADAPTSERKVHEALRTGLDDSFVVFHSVSWHGRNRKPDGEVDFLVAHADHGLLVIEVKGGQIGVDPRAGTWLSKDGMGEIHVIKDPYDQALTAKHTLIKEIADDRRWSSGRDVLIGYAVALTDTVVGDDRLPRAKPEITFDRRDMPRLGERVVECLRYWKEVDGRRSPGENGINSLIEMYGLPRLYKVPLSQLLEEDERKIIELTNQQYGLLGMLGRRRRAAIAGCAGSGKTLIAFEKARQLALSGRDVLFTCFNRSLAGYLRESMDVPQGLQVQTYHAFCADLARSAGQTPPPDLAPGSEAHAKWLASAAGEVLATTGGSLDAVIVDEGQDFESAWFDTLQRALTEGPDGLFYVFYDDNQRLYSQAGIPEWFGEPYELTVNCRNTERIGHLVKGLYQGGEMTLSSVQGREVVYGTYPDDGPSQAVPRLNDMLRNLRKAGARPEDIVVLSPRRDGPTWQRRDFENWRLYSRAEKDGNVFYDTIHSFKGQDSRIVILVELELAGKSVADDPARFDELLYVGCSRATTQLVVIGPTNLINRLKGFAGKVPS